jgi:alpha-1,2-mannosyltransferase
MRARRGRRWRSLPAGSPAGLDPVLAVGGLVAATALGAYLAALATHPVPATLKGFDLRVYLDGARQAMTHPGALYTWAVKGHPGIQFTYTPFAALLFAPGLALPFAVLMALLTAASVAAVATTVSIAFRQLGWRGARRAGATLLVAGVALWTEPVQRALYLGQVEPLLMALVTWDLCQPGRRRLRGAATGVGAGIKLVPLLFIAYLFITGRRRQAAVGGAAFAGTVLIGWTVFPRESAAWWLGGDFFQAGRTGFIGDQLNQSLRAVVIRFAGSVPAATPLWLAFALLAGMTGLAAAAALHRRGYTFAGLLGCALTALLVSPISWDHHWVWAAPGLALLIDAAARAVRAARPLPAGRARARPAVLAVFWTGLTLAVAASFGAWPKFWSARAGLLGGGLIGYAPGSAWAHGDNPAYLEYHWHGLQLAAGNLEIAVGTVLFAVLLACSSLR